MKVWIKAHSEKKKIRKAAQGRIIYIAMEKLLGTRDPNTLKLANLKANDVLAILAARVQLSINPFSAICVKMLCDNLATCLRVADNRDSIEIAYPSEPILAEASARLLNKFNNWSFFIHVLRKSLNSSVLVGDKQNAGVQMVLLMAWDRTIERHDIEYRLLSNQHLNYCRHARVNDFLVSLLGEKSLAKVARGKTGLFKEAFMYFTHFAQVQIGEFIRREHLVEALRFF